MTDIPQLNLKSTYDAIDSLKHLTDCDCQGLSSVPSKNKLQIDANELALLFQASYSHELHKHWFSYLPEYHLVANNQDYIIPQGTSVFEGNLLTYSQEPMDLKINLNVILQAAVRDGKEHYWRYVYPVDTSEWFLKISSLPYKDDLGGMNTQALLNLSLDNSRMQIFTHKHNGNKYCLVVESKDRITQEEMEHRTISIIVALGLVLGKRYGSHRFIIASSTSDFSSILGIGVTKLQKTKVCRYRIFDTKRTNVLDMLNMFDYQQYAKDEIADSDTSVKWYYDEAPMPHDAFCKLAELCYNNNDMLVAASMLLDGSLLNIEYQKPFYHVALETITTSLMSKRNVKLSPLMDKAAYKQNVLPVLQTALAGISEIPDDVRHIISQRIQNNLNAPANQDKLSYLFEKYNYPLTEPDKAAIKSRNSSFHGHLTSTGISLREQEDELFAESLRLHKLCCILLLKAAGYSGRILNNEVLFGIKDACDRKEHVYIEI